MAIVTRPGVKRISNAPPAPCGGRPTKYCRASRAPWRRSALQSLLATDSHFGFVLGRKLTRRGRRAFGAPPWRRQHEWRPQRSPGTGEIGKLLERLVRRAGLSSSRAENRTHADGREHRYEEKRSGAQHGNQRLPKSLGHCRARPSANVTFSQWPPMLPSRSGQYSTAILSPALSLFVPAVPLQDGGRTVLEAPKVVRAGLVELARTPTGMHAGSSIRASLPYPSRYSCEPCRTNARILFGLFTNRNGHATCERVRVGVRVRGERRVG